MEVTIKITVNGNDVTVETETDVYESVREILKEEALSNPFGNISVMFDANSLAWTDSREYNKRFLCMQERLANELLRARGHVFLNEVYDMLSLPRTKLGAILGWVYDKENPIGHNCVVFGLNRFCNHAVCNSGSDFVLDFNVDGIILDYIE